MVASGSTKRARRSLQRKLVWTGYGDKIWRWDCALARCARRYRRRARSRFDTIPELVTHFYLLTHRDMHRTPRVRAFFEFVDTEIKAFRAVLSGNPNGARNSFS